MNKKDLIKKVADAAGITQVAARIAVDTVLAEFQGRTISVKNTYASPSVKGRAFKNYLTGNVVEGTIKVVKVKKAPAPIKKIKVLKTKSSYSITARGSNGTGSGGPGKVGKK